MKTPGCQLGANASSGGESATGFDLVGRDNGELRRSKESEAELAEPGKLDNGDAKGDSKLGITKGGAVAVRRPAPDGVD